VPSHLWTNLLALGYAAGEGYWLMMVGYNGLAVEHQSRGFTAIGSGFDAANIVALMLDNYEPRERPVEHLKMLAYRMVSGCIEALAQFVGGPIQLWSSKGGGAFERASDDELTELNAAASVWRGVERESLAVSLGQAVDVGVKLPDDLQAEEAEVAERSELGS
jgi:hypothetical protein